MMTTISPEAPASQDSAHIVADQSVVAAFLSDPASYGADVTAVQRIDTHASMVFLAGDRVYKVKRAVKFPYLDYATLERRHRFCLMELETNRRTAPDLYLEVTPVVRRPDGGLVLGGEGVVIEWVLVMRRFEQETLFDRLAEAGQLTAPLIRGLGEEILAFHGTAKRRRGEAGRGGGAAGMEEVLEETLIEFAERPDLFPSTAVESLGARARDRLASIAALLDRRLAEGFVRDCHGDLHLRNICLFEGRPTLFDAIEFNPALSRIDILYDLAFLLMDLDHQGLRPLGNLLLNRYLQDGSQLEALAVLPLFLSQRAAIRAKVSASAEASQAEAGARQAMQQAAQGYFEQAGSYLDPPSPVLVAVGGLSGSGKSTLAARLAPAVGAAPGALHLRSDVLRKDLFGVRADQRLAPAAYRPEVSEDIYQEMLRRARIALSAKHSVVLDAVYVLQASRCAVNRLAKDLGVPLTGFWLDAPEDRLTARVAARQGDVSDATPDVVRLQAGEDRGVITWHRLDAGQPLDHVESIALKVLQIESQKPYAK